jgi:protein-disulfide isomerase
MASRSRGISPLVIAVGLLVLGVQPWAFAQKGRKISVGDAPSVKAGSPKLVLVEFGDFQCPYCGRGAREVLPKVYEKFVPTEKIEIIFLNLPLQMHPYAFKAAEAAACAGDQGMFWDMHHELFENQTALAPDRLSGYAEAVGVDVAVFQQCLSKGRHAAGIRADMRTAQSLGITGTPAYVIGRRLPGGDKVQVLEVLHGFTSYEEFEKKLEVLLASK